MIRRYVFVHMLLSLVLGCCAVITVPLQAKFQSKDAARLLKDGQESKQEGKDEYYDSSYYEWSQYHLDRVTRPSSAPRQEMKVNPDEF
jgi:hypothetical protein